MELTSMGFTEGMLFGAGRKAKDGPKVLDWERAAEFCASKKAPVWAGLAEDWEYTSGLIWDGSRQVRDYVYVASNWATPVLVIEGRNNVVPCFRLDDGDAESGYPAWWGEGAADTEEEPDD